MITSGNDKTNIGIGNKLIHINLNKEDNVMNI